MQKYSTMIYFFHGFESSLPSGKVDILNNLGFPSTGIPMNYNSSTPYKNIEKLVSKNKPSMIVGSSMGGFFALKIGTFYNIPLILLNPALGKINSTLDTPKNYGEFRPKIWALLGETDELIPAHENKLALENFGASVTIGDHGHRTPNDVFFQYIKNIKSKLIEIIE